MTDHVDLLDALDDLADHLVWPDPDVDVVAPTLETLRAAPTDAARTEKRWLLAAAVVLVAALAITAIPASREAVADLLGIGSVRVTRQSELPPVLGATLDLGRAVTIEEAEDLTSDEVVGAALAVPLPVARGVGKPDGAFAGRPPHAVTLVWSPSDELPEVLQTGAGLLISVFPGDLDEPTIEKRVASAGTVEPVTVQGVPGYWLEGAPHGLLYVDKLGDAQEDTIRLSGNALLWERDGVTYRLESALSQADAIQLAETIPT